METVRTVTYSDIWLDELNNVRYSTDFELVLGRVNEEYRFIPQGITVEQGLTPEMLDVVSSLIRKKAGIGKKKAEPIKEDTE
jgi:hypothetical protein